MSAESRNLDVLRAVAVLSVFVSHILFNVFGVEQMGIFAAHEIGRMGVLIFFIHTSLVLLMSMERTRTQRPFLNFYVRRALRIYPLSIACVLAVTLLSIPPMVGQSFVPITVPEFLSNAFLIQNVTGSRALLGPMWSLPYEVQMYLVLPVLFFLIRNRSVAFAASVWACTFAVQAIAIIHQLRPLRELIQFAPWFFGGVFVYRISREYRAVLPGWLWPVALGVVFTVHAALWTSDKPVRRKIGEYLVSILLSLILPHFEDLSESFFTRAAQVVAKYSYGTYLFHAPILWFSFVHVRGFAQPLCVVALMILVPWICYHGIELPMMRIGKVAAEKLCFRREILSPIFATAQSQARFR